jgi:HD-GYP domain-containing protein (c-di-GMP phosphodiesterase class II)
VRGQAPVVTRTPVTGHPYGFLINDWTMRGRSLGYVAVAMDAQFVQDSLAMARVILVILFAATALGTIILGLVLADRITRPIDQLIASMHGVSTGDYERRVAVDSADEIGFLGQAFNDMASALRTQRREREEGYFRNLEALARAIDARDPYTFEHSARVAAISVILATAMDWPADEVASLRRAGLLHDVGKIGVADRILAKISPLTDDEWASIRQHPIIGYDMLKDVPFLQASLAGIRHHHERWDGEGYPDGLTAEENPAPARIVAVADAFDAMTSDRPYRKGFSFGFAAKTIASESGRQFDPAVVAAFVKTEPLILAKLEEMGKRPAPHAADIRLDEAA